MPTFREELQQALAGSYELGEELTGGGMSRVFVATERALGRKVVVKVLPPELAAGVNRERFRREIQLAARLQHPHIVPLLSAGEVEGGSIDGGERLSTLYYTMPFIEGESLRERLARSGALPVRDVVRMLHDVVDALAYAHARGVVHRDIKPGNILTQGSHALVTDFGVAKALSAALPGAGSTTSGTVVGTPAYMAPEQLAADPSADHRMDLYAVGLVAYELLSGESPFTGTSPAATMAAQLTRDPPPLHSLRGDVPPALSALIGRCLAKDPEHRPQTAPELLAALEEVPVPSGPTTPASRMAPGAAAGRRPGWLVPVSAAGVIVVVALAIIVLRPTGRERPAAGDSGAPSVLAPPAPPATPAPPESAVTSTEGAAARPALTHADSLAIARAFQKELQPKNSATKPAPGAAEVRQQLIDSLVRVSMAEWTTAESQLRQARRNLELRGDSSGRVRVYTSADAHPRVLVLGPSASQRREMDPALVQLSDRMAAELRSRLGRDGGYVLVRPDSTQMGAVGPAESGRVPIDLRAEVVASVSLIRVPGDSVVGLIRLRDLAAAPEYSYRVASTPPVPMTRAADVAHDAVRSAAGFVREMTSAPKRFTLDSTSSRLIFDTGR